MVIVVQVHHERSHRQELVTTLGAMPCGAFEEIEEPLMREIRYIDKLIDELAKGRPMEKILRDG